MLPRIAPRHPRKGSSTIVIGHRGDPSRFPENAIEGILAAADHASMAEIDVRPAADGTLVLSHDAVLRGTTLIEHPWETLQHLELGDGHRLGRFDELVERAGPFPLNVEIKNWPHDPDFDEQLEFPLRAAALCRPHDLITCFHWPTMEAIRREFPGLQTGLLVDVGVDPETAGDEAREGGHQALALHGSALASNPAGVRAALRDLEIYVWTVNDATYALRLADAGVDGLITDDPAAMVAALQGA